MENNNNVQELRSDQEMKQLETQRKFDRVRQIFDELEELIQDTDSLMAIALCMMMFQMQLKEAMQKHSDSRN